jgi:ribonuclease P protein component
MPAHAAGGIDYVLIARGDTPRRPFPALLADLETALRRLEAWREGTAEC